MATIAWFGDSIVDWANAGRKYSLDNKVIQLGHYSYGFGDAAIISEDGVYAFIYKRLGTKGLLLKNGELLREINRSYYCSGTYECPAAFVTLDETTYLIHCPLAYNQLDFENVETGEIITNIKGRNPSDTFYSRLEISPDNRMLMSKGWNWHPLDVIKIFNIKDCIKNPMSLDESTICPNAYAEFCTANFITEDKVLIGSSEEIFDDEDIKFPPKSIAVWDLKTDTFSDPIFVKAEFGNLYSINGDLAWDLYKYPKIINIKTGEIVDKDENIDSGNQCSSIIHSLNNYPQIILNRQTKQIAIAGDEKIEILTPDL